VLIEQVRATLRERRLLEGARRVLVACSGGPDSTVLLHVLHRLREEHGCELVAASIDHGLRATAADDVACAGRSAAALGVAFVPLAVVVAPGASKQAHARRARYAALVDCAASVGAERIAVGHTQDDQAETVLARLLRGTGLPGLSGIAPAREDGVIRPLIDCRRAQVHAYVRDHELEVALDPSNEDLRFGRVRIRRQVLPALMNENAHLVPALCALADEAREARDLIAAECRRVLAAGPPNARRLRAESSSVRRWVLKDWCQREHGIALLRTHLGALERMLMHGGEVRLPGDWVATLDHELNVNLRPIEKRGRGSERHLKGEQS